MGDHSRLRGPIVRRVESCGRPARPHGTHGGRPGLAPAGSSAAARPRAASASGITGADQLRGGAVGCEPRRPSTLHAVTRRADDRKVTPSARPSQILLRPRTVARLGRRPRIRPAPRPILGLHRWPGFSIRVDTPMLHAYLDAPPPDPVPSNPHKYRSAINPPSIHVRTGGRRRDLVRCPVRHPLSPGQRSWLPEPRRPAPEPSITRPVPPRAHRVVRIHVAAAAGSAPPCTPITCSVPRSRRFPPIRSAR